MLVLAQELAAQALHPETTEALLEVSDPVPIARFPEFALIRQ
jgi:hypothetical protein